MIWAHNHGGAAEKNGTMANDPDILFERRGAAGVVTLNRPHALNAVTLGMVRALAAQLEAWAHDGAVTRVLVTAAGGRAFCTGGDLRAVYEAGRAGRHEEALDFWRAEYPLNAMIKTYRKPYVALIDGIVMGGGVGISVHGSHRVAGDRFVFAMPEVGIGFFPDVGATWFLPRMPGELGTYCALAGERLDAADALVAGVATHSVASSRWPELFEALCGTTPVDAVLRTFAEPVGESRLTPWRTDIDRLFAGESVEEILAALDASAATSDWCRSIAATLRTKSPTSLKIALAQMRRGKTLSFDACMQTEFRIVSRVVHGHDFYEGVRAVIIDKDNAPQWQPADLAAVSEAEVARHFDPLAVELALS
jgi:enoyl-CoA hydratase